MRSRTDSMASSALPGSASTPGGMTTDPSGTAVSPPGAESCGAPAAGSSIRTPLPSMRRTTRLPSRLVTMRTPSLPTLTSASPCCAPAAESAGGGSGAGAAGGAGGSAGVGGATRIPSGVTETITLTRSFGSEASTTIAGPPSKSQLLSIAPATSTSSDRRKNLPQPTEASQSPNRLAAAASRGAAARAPAATSAAICAPRPWPRCSRLAVFGSGSALMARRIVVRLLG